MRRAILVDGYELFRASIRDILVSTRHFDEVYEADSSGSFLRAAMTGEPVDLAVIHPRSVGLGEADCLKLVDRMMGETRVLLFRDAGMPANDARDSAHIRVLPRNAGCEDVEAAIGNLLRLAGMPRGFDTLPASHSRQATTARHSIARSLSRRQREIMAMVAEGLANKEIAHRLGIAEGTVKAHIHAVFRALNVTNRTQAVVRYGPALRAAAL